MTGPWLTAEELTRRSGVAPSWFGGIRGLSFPPPQRQTDPPRWDATQVEHWQAAQRLEASLTPVTTESLRLVARRLRGEPVTRIAADLARSEPYVSQRSVQEAARAVLDVEPGVVRVLAERRAAGDADTALAARIHAGRSLVRLVLDGWRQPAPDTGDVVRHLWLAGESLPAIAERIGQSSQVTHRRLARLNLPERLSLADIARRLGVSRSSVTTFGISKVLPAPDGLRPSGRPWWWAANIDTWARQTLKTCPVCGARVVGLHQHQRRAHP